MQEVVEHLKGEGFDIGIFVPDGKLHRFALDAKDKRKSGFYVGYQNFLPSNGQQYFFVQYGSWREGQLRSFSTIKGEMSLEDRKLDKQYRERARKESDRERQKAWEEAAQDVEEIWKSLAMDGHSDYLDRKQIPNSEALGIRFKDGNIYVPLRDHQNKLWSIQRIDRDGVKRFHPGARASNCCHVVGPAIDGTTVYFAEGFATAASVHLATGRSVVCAFSATGLASAAAWCRENYPDADITICGDDDREREGNPGRRAAEAAAKKVLGKVVFPEFAVREHGGTDFNDLYILEGPGVVRAQIDGGRDESTPRVYLAALGFKEKEYFFTSSQNQQIVPVTGFSKTDFLNLMPIEYWEAVFPGAGKSRVDWDSAGSELMARARAKGIFESQNIRGAGVWNDEGRVVVNLGDSLIVDGKRMSLGDLKSRYFYTLGVKIPDLHNNPLSTKECEIALSACEMFKWKRKDFGPLLAGAMVTTRVCGALPIRPHVWLTGEKGSGKSTLINRLLYPLIGKPLIFAGGNTSEAGLRQQLSANAVPVLFDEFENNGQKSIEAIQSILDLMRLSWSETDAAIIKGSSSGVASSYRVRFAGIVSSIRQVSMSDADRSRFATLELDAHESDLTHWGQMDGALSQIDEEYGNRLFARTIKLLPVLLKNFHAMKAALNRRSPGQRFGDQYGMLLAGTALLTQEEPLSPTEADVIARLVDLTEEREDAQIKDQDSALEHLLTTRIMYQADGDRREDLIGTLIQSAHMAGATKALNLVGIRVQTDQVVIATGNHSELSKLFRGTKWDGSWGRSLARLIGSDRTVLRIDGKLHRCVTIPILHFT